MAGLVPHIDPDGLLEFSVVYTDRALNLYRRHGLLALVVPALLPPPAPFKLFVLMAGVAGVRPVPFALGIGLARGARYVALGYLAIRYGDQGLELMRTHGPTVAVWLVGLILAGVAAGDTVVTSPAPALTDGAPVAGGTTTGAGR